MPVEVILPKVDMDMSHGTLSTWHVAEGELVQKGAPLFDIETDKAAMEVEAPAAGYLRRIAAQPGDKVPVGTIIAWLYAEGEAFDVPAATAPAAADHRTPDAVAQPSVEAVVVQPVPAMSNNAGSRAPPAARKAARKAGGGAWPDHWLGAGCNWAM